MTATFRPPKAVLAETELPATLTAAEVVELRTAGGLTGAWASRVIDGLLERASIVKENTTMPETRAIGPDVPLADALAYTMIEVLEMYARAHESHWNVTGPDFAEYHDLFGDIYSDVYGSIDPIAENIRKLGSLAPSIQVPQADARNTEAGVLAAMLLEENDEVLMCLRATFDIATAAGQQGIANFLAERQDMHQKWAWQLRSSLGIAEIGQPLAPIAPEAVEEPEANEAPIETNAADIDTEARRSLIESAEKRVFTTEVRAALADGEVRVSGYAAMWDQEADGLPFREVIKRGAFQRSLDRGDDVFLLVNHDTDQLPLARRSSGTLELVEDETGLRMEAVLDPSNPRAAELASALERGDVDKMSFAFRVAENGSMKNTDGVRELRNLDLFEVSVVTWPAYSATTVGKRSADDAGDLEARWLQAKWDNYRTK